MSDDAIYTYTPDMMRPCCPNCGAAVDQFSFTDNPEDPWQGTCPNGHTYTFQLEDDEDDEDDEDSEERPACGWTAPNPDRWVSFELEEVCEYQTETGHTYIETKRLSGAPAFDQCIKEFWTVYGRLPNGEVDALVDSSDYQRARDALAVLERGIHKPKPPAYCIDERLPWEMETTTAMAIWEDVLARVRNTPTDQDSDVTEIMGAIGTCDARELFACMALPMDQAWLIASQLGYDEPFDWEFVPAMMRELLPEIVENSCAVPDRRVWLMVLEKVVGHLGDVEQALENAVEDCQ
jgi:hypothetical protein